MGKTEQFVTTAPPGAAGPFLHPLVTPRCKADSGRGRNPCNMRMGGQPPPLMSLPLPISLSIKPSRSPMLRVRYIVVPAAAYSPPRPVYSAYRLLASMHFLGRARAGQPHACISPHGRSPSKSACTYVQCACTCANSLHTLLLMRTCTYTHTRSHPGTNAPPPGASPDTLWLKACRACVFF